MALNSESSIKLIDLLCEGPIEGLATQSSKSIFLDETSADQKAVKSNDFAIRKGTASQTGDGGEAEGQGLTGEQPLDAWHDAIGATGQIEHPGTVVGQNMHLLHRGHRCRSGSDQPAPLVEQAEVVGIALQQAMSNGGAAPEHQAESCCQRQQQRWRTSPWRGSAFRAGVAGHRWG